MGKVYIPHFFLDSMYLTVVYVRVKAKEQIDKNTESLCSIDHTGNVGEIKNKNFPSSFYTPYSLCEFLLLYIADYAALSHEMPDGKLTKTITAANAQCTPESKMILICNQHRYIF